jgi:hypothetical protein
MSNLPFEIIQIIYNYSSIDVKQCFNKIFNHESFIQTKLHVNYNQLTILNQMCSFKHTNYIVMKELSQHFNFL